MQKLLIIFSLFVFANCEGQTNSDSLNKAAFHYYSEDIHYDSALYFYKQIERFSPNSYILCQEGLCYKYLNDTLQAKKYLFKALDVYEKDTNGIYSPSIAMDIADVFTDGKNFKEALFYLDYSKKKYKNKKHMCRGGYDDKLEFAYKKAVCYYGLNQKDTAIKILMPLVFRPTSDVYLDSTEYDEISYFFANAVFNVYGRDKARKMLLQSVDKTVYSATSKLGNKPRPLTFTIVCYLYFLDYKLDLGSDSFSDFERNEPLPKAISKEAYLKEFKDSPAYRYIIQPTTIL